MTVDALADRGVVRMDRDEIESFLSSRDVGVLGISTGGPPLMRPISYTYDPAATEEERERLIMLYVGGEESEKLELSDRTEQAGFLVYTVDTPFTWQSVLLTGRIEPVSDSDADELRISDELPWQPEYLRMAGRSQSTHIYQLDVTERAGLKQVGLPPGFEANGADGH